MNRLGRATAAAAVLASLATVTAAQSGQPHELPPLGERDERLTRLFTPSAAPPGIYEVRRSTRPITTLSAELRALDPVPLADAWKVARLAPGDAFGSEAPYDASRLARLYGGSPPLVARGTLRTGEGAIAVTLVSPFPDADLGALRPGTMVIVVHVTAQTGWR